MYSIVISKYDRGLAYKEVFRFKAENLGELQNDMQVLRFVRSHCQPGYSVCVDPFHSEVGNCFISYRSLEGQPFRKITFFAGCAAQDVTEIPWEQL
jgi:hypothetical protein